MKGKIELQREYFGKSPTVVYRSDGFTVSMFRYNSGVEGLELTNSRGKIVVLPYMGQIIWDLEFDSVNMKMKNMYTEPKKASCIIDTYGCFAYHSGLVRNGCPSPEDDHVLHGEMPCAEMDIAWLEITENSIKITGSVEYVKGFGHHYMAHPSATMFAGKSHIEIGMDVRNLASVPMPLQYMCHTNYAYFANATLSQNIPDSGIVLRQTIPSHVKPTPKWLEFNKELLESKVPIKVLERPEMYDPEIVFFADRIDKYQKRAHFEMAAPDGTTLFAEFDTSELKYATRWLLYNGDQQVGAFVLPATCRPEGFLAAQKAGTLIMLQPNEEKSFRVVSGKK